MKNTKLSFKNHFSNRLGFSLIRKFILSFLATLPFAAMAQIQQGIPKPTGPVDLSKTSDLVIFIILPAIVIIIFFFWRKAIKKRYDKRKREDID